MPKDLACHAAASTAQTKPRAACTALRERTRWLRPEFRPRFLGAYYAGHGDEMGKDAAPGVLIIDCSVRRAV